MTATVRLSPRQAECLRLVWERQATSKEIAAELGISSRTVDSYIAEAVELLGARDRREAAAIAYGNSPRIDYGGHSSRVVEDPSTPATSIPPGRPAHPLGPLSPQNRDADNDSGVFARLAWILLLAIGLAVGFGSIVSSTRAISDVVRDGQRSAR